MESIGNAILIVGSVWLACEYPGFVIPAFILVLFGLDRWADVNSYFDAKTKYYLAKTKLIEEIKKRGKIKCPTV